MNDKKVVLVTGVAGYWGAHVAATLHLEPGLHVIGLDEQPPAFEIEGLDYVDAGVENPLLADFLNTEGVEVICHMKFMESVDRDGDARSANIQGAKNILKAGYQAGIRQIIFRSSTAVYGAHPDNPAFLTEDMPHRGSRSYGYTSDWLEVESLIADSRDRAPQTSLAVLRFANIVGSSAETPFTSFLNQTAPLVLFGFDPVMQMVHESDVLAAISFSVLNNTEGVFNIAADGAMPLSRILRLVRRFPMPIFHPIAYRGLNLMRKGQYQACDYVPIEWDYLRYPWVADTGKMHREMGFLPSISSEDGLLEFAGRLSSESKGSESDEPPTNEAHMREIMQRRAQERNGDIRGDGEIE
ncbi:MAG: NAD-dependent epimerase/dehydratase family protein [Candidatus Promineifilaceae bacterium]